MASTKADKRREDLREQHWPGSGNRVWKGPKEIGYWCAPRGLPLLLHLVANNKKIVRGLDCSSVYIDLSSRDFGQGIIEIQDEDEHAYSSGYTGSRARRSWQERVRALKDAGFIEIAPKGNRPIGYILMIHPSEVVLQLRRDKKIDDPWWNMYQDHLRSVGAGVLSDPLASTELRLIDGGAEVSQSAGSRAPARRKNSSA